jgi:hypothetical protein
MNYKSELLKLYPSLQFMCIFLYSVHFKIFLDSKNAFYYFRRVLVLTTLNRKIQKCDANSCFFGLLSTLFGKA